MSIQTRTSRLLTSLLLLTLLTLLSACGSSGSDSYLRVVHGSADAPAVDVLLDGEVVLSNVPFTVASSYLKIDDGDRRIQVNAAGTSTTVIDATVNFEGDTFYTVLASGPLSAISPLVLMDDSATMDDMAKVRVVHNAASAPAVDVYVTAPGADLATSTPVLTNVPFEAASDYLPVPGGTYQVRVTVAGTTTVAIDTGAIDFANGTNYTAIALDATGGGAPFQAILLVDQPMM